MATHIPRRPLPHTHIPASHLESHGNSRLWTEPDFLPNNGDAELPALSAIGRGPRGEGVLIEVDETEDSYKLTFKSDITGEVVCQSGNLSAGIVSAHQIDTETVAGQTTTFYIDITRDGTTQSYPIVVNPGETGSRIFVVSGGIRQMMARPVGTFNIGLHDLTYYSTLNWNDMPAPRVADSVITNVLLEDGSVTIGIGTIMAIDGDRVTIVIQCLYPARTPYIKDGNWWIGDTDTGVCASGMNEDQIKSEIKEEVSEVLANQHLLTKEEIEELIDEKISAVNYYINDNGILVRETTE